MAVMRGTPNSWVSNPVTPGCSSAKLYGLRDVSGSDLISRSFSVRPWSTLPRLTIGESAVTETTSVTCPTPSVMLTTAVWPAESVTPDCSNFLNPCSSAITR